MDPKTERQKALQTVDAVDEIVRAIVMGRITAWSNTGAITGERAQELRELFDTEGLEAFNEATKDLKVTNTGAAIVHGYAKMPCHNNQDFDTRD